MSDTTIARRLAGMAARFLPAPGGDPARRWTGKRSGTPLTESFLTLLARRAARLYLEEDGGTEAPRHPRVDSTPGNAFGPR